jgi:hypothetical protein
VCCKGKLIRPASSRHHCRLGRRTSVMTPNRQNIAQASIRRGARRGIWGLVDLCSDYPEVSIRVCPTSPSTRSRLPTELLSLIFSSVCLRDLASLTQTSSAFHHIATRLLYQDLSLKSLSTRQWIRCLRTLTRNPSLSTFVRSLDIDWQCLQPTRNLYLLLHTVLKSLTSLKSLNLDFPTHQSPTWVLDGCTFSLRHFTTSLHCKASLARFLESQPGIVELTLRGFQSAKSSLNPFHILSPDMDIQLLSTDFELRQGSLPLLTLFNAVHAGPPIIRTVANGRGVQTASVPLFPRCAAGTLDALTLTSGTIRRLSLISFDPEAPSFLFANLAERFPRLEALHVVLLLTRCNLVGICYLFLLRKTWLMSVYFHGLGIIRFNYNPSYKI